MREQLKQQIRDLIGALGRAEAVLDSRSKKGELDAVKRQLEDMQNSAIAIGEVIEDNVGAGTETVKGLEDYCELLWRYFIEESRNERAQLGAQLAKTRCEVMKHLEREITTRLEVIFLVSKAERWKQMDGLWRNARGQEIHNCHVVSVPYYICGERGREEDARSDLEFLPTELQAVSSGDYDFQINCPDIVFMDGPFCGKGESGIEAGYILDEIREHTGILNYMPCYEDESQVAQAHCRLPQVKAADMIVLPSEAVRSVYIKAFKSMENGQELIKKIYVASPGDSSALLKRGRKKPEL